MTNLEKQALLDILERKGIKDTRVLNAMSQVPREKFIAPSKHAKAYDNEALAIECQQTISQPYIVAHMTQCLLQNKMLPSLKILEIGTGSGYQTAVLSELVDELYSIERIQKLHTNAQALLKKLDYKNIHFRYSDGHLGWPEAAPFDGIIVTAGTASIPPALLEQLSSQEGRLIIPVGKSDNLDLISVTRIGNHYQSETIEKVSFVPLKSGVE